MGTTGALRPRVAYRKYCRGSAPPRPGTPVHRVPCRFAPVTLRRCPSCRFPRRKPFGFPPYLPRDPGWRTELALVCRQRAPETWGHESYGTGFRRAGACSRRLYGKRKLEERNIFGVRIKAIQKSGEEREHSRRTFVCLLPASLRSSGARRAAPLRTLTCRLFTVPTGRSGSFPFVHFLALISMPLSPPAASPISTSMR